MSTLPAGITPAGSGKVGSQDVKWNILGHVYWLKAESDDCFAFETLDPPGTFVPPHVHPAQDEFIYMLEGTFDLYLVGSWTKAGAGDLVRMPRGIPHGYYNRSEKPARALFWVTPAGRLRALFDQLNDLGDVEEVVRRSAPIPRMPTTGSADCCECAASGHPAAAPPISEMNCRLLIQSPRRLSRGAMAVR